MSSNERDLVSANSLSKDARFGKKDYGMSLQGDWHPAETEQSEDSGDPHHGCMDDVAKEYLTDLRAPQRQLFFAASAKMDRAVGQRVKSEYDSRCPTES